MKLLSSSMLLTFIVIGSLSYAQEKEANKEDVNAAEINTEYGSPFQKGTWNFGLREFIHNQNGNRHNNSFKMNLEAKYFLVNNFALGTRMYLTGNGLEVQNGSLEENSSTYKLSLGAVYGRSFGRLNFMLECWAGFGNSTAKYYINPDPVDVKSSSTYFEFALGSPIRLGNRPIYFTPRFGWQINRHELEINSVEDSFSKHSGLFLDLDIEFYLNGNSTIKSNRFSRLNPSRYKKGANHVGVGTSGNFSSNKIIYEEDDEVVLETNNIFYSLTVSGFHYLLNNVAIGLDAGFSNDVSKDNSSGQKYSYANYSIMPMIRANLPVEGGFNDLFAQIGYGFATGGTKLLGAGMGYNYFIHRNISFTPGIFYFQRRNNFEGGSSKSDGWTITLRAGITF